MLLIGATVFLSFEPSLFLVVLALGLSALTLTWIVLLARFLLLDAFARRAAAPTNSSGHGANPLAR